CGAPDVQEDRKSVRNISPHSGQESGFSTHVRSLMSGKIRMCLKNISRTQDRNVASPLEQKTGISPRPDESSDVCKDWLMCLKNISHTQKQGIWSSHPYEIL
ncbi:unnamed protein product, partial [Staurois parvus]